MHTKISIVLLTGLLFSFDLLPMDTKEQGPKGGLADLLKDDGFKRSLLNKVDHGGAFDMYGRTFSLERVCKGKGVVGVIQITGADYVNVGDTVDNMRIYPEYVLVESGVFKDSSIPLEGTLKLGAVLDN
jgi:hypothetical protein